MSNRIYLAVNEDYEPIFDAPRRQKKKVRQGISFKWQPVFGIMPKTYLCSMLLLQNHEIKLLLATVLLPALSIPFLYILPKKANPGWIASAIGFVQIVLSTHTFIATYQGITFEKSWAWLMLPQGLFIQIGIQVDLLSALLLLMVAFISCLVALYATAYLPPLSNFQRYFSLHKLSVTAMCWILVADNLWGMLLGWELLSISSCLLIGFWYQSHDAIQASTFAWVVSKLGSICFLVGTLLTISELGSCNLSTLAGVDAYTRSHLSNKMLIAGCCLILAAFTKSAQFPFFSWLPRAMVAPTPASALLHTATVLSAGIYLLVRLEPILPLELNSLLVIVGYLTAFLGTSAALAQPHLKRMLAYSTFSHLGYVVAAIGLGNTAAGVLYLIVHALSKACLFLLAGVINQFLQAKGVAKKEAYNLSYMGGFLHRLPWVALSYLVAIGGIGMIPGLISFRAKESILAQTLAWAAHAPGNYLHYTSLLLALVSTGLTILYLGQAFIRIFLGKPRWENQPPASLPSLGSHSGLWILQGSMVVCASFVLISSYLLDNWATCTEASFSPSLQAPITAWQPILSTYYQKIYYITQLISYGWLLLMVLWLVVRWLKSTQSIAISTTQRDNHHLFPDIPLKAGMPATKVDYQEAIAETTGLARLLRSLAITLLKLLRQLVVITSYSFRQLFLHGWYLDSCTTFLGRQVVAFSRLMAQVEERFFGGLIKGLTVGYVVMAHMTHWLDSQLIEGIGHRIAIFSQQGSKLYLYLQSGRIQLYILWSCIGIGILGIIWMVLWKI